MAEEREALIMEGERERMEAGGGEEMQPKETEAVVEPEVTEPEVTEPEITEPEVTKPEVTEPEIAEPEVTEPEETRPAGKKPGGQSASRKKRMRFGSVALALSFLVPFTLMIAIFIGNGIYPFGKRSFLFSDMYHQYMPFFQEFMRMIKAGEGISYSWNVGIGSNFLALYVYYLASPFNWLAFLFPADHLMEFMSYAVVVKIGLAGLTAFLYLRSREAIENTGLRDYGALAASLLYAMSGFVAAYNWNVMWMDCVVLLPLILMGLEKLVRKGKMGLYVAALAFCILTNFYISIMVCLFLVLYFIYLFLAEKRSFSMIWKFAFGSLLAGGLAAVLLVPEVKALMATDFGDMDFPKKWESYFSILDVLARHSAAITTERALEHWPNIYCGTMVFFMIPLYAVNEKIPARKRLGMLALMGIFLVSFSTNVLDFIWHGLNYPDSLPARQSFIYVMMVLVACYDCFIHLEGLRGKEIIKVYLATVLFLLCVEKFVDVSDFADWNWILNVGIVTVLAACLYVYLEKRGMARYVAACIAFAMLMGESAANMAYTSVGTTDRTAYLKHVKDYQVLYERNVASREGFSRAEKFTRKTKNDAVLSGFPSASIFSSTMNSYVMDLYTKIGMQHSKVYYGYDGATPFTAALFNVGYVFAESDEWENELYKLIDEENGIYLYEAKYTLPFGYVVPRDFDVPNDLNDRGVVLQNRLTKELGAWDTMLVKEKGEEDGDDVRFTATQDGIYYGYVTKSGTSKIKMTGDVPGEKVELKDLKYATLFYVGELKQGEKINLTNGDENDSTKKIAVSVYRLNTDAVEEALNTLRRQSLTNVKVEGVNVSGHLDLEEAGKLVLSIPRDDGWKITVNGKESQADTFGGALIALNLEPGEYDVALRFEPAGKSAGAWISIASAMIAALFFGLPCLLRKRKEKK